MVRDSETWQKLDNDDEGGLRSEINHKIGDNTDFYKVANENLSMFCSNDLESLKQEYSNSSQNWRDHYNATIVVPVATRHKDKPMYFGFVALDSLNSDRQELFVDSKENELYQILKTLAEALAIWHLEYESYMTNTFKEHELIREAYQMNLSEEFLLGKNDESESMAE